jgi:hypothetical protein
MVQNIALGFVMGGAGGTAQVGGYYDDELVDRCWELGKLTCRCVHIQRICI